MKFGTWIKWALVATAIWGFAAGINRIDLEAVGSAHSGRMSRIDAVR